ncbi:hypothetical protein CHLRE_11g467736v5 [Chlamydomonas reinhardtii]|uniref:Sulfotransferase n=1 Tax=Chlamydomonas reinhardtii TaxID=3055 RepID=A0A2K3D7W4_CHLRE|nr:uncharacterized protein CHLRE_11g467736v5 [Chlamydomonas reinhardtii]PNW76615.1 hypothetical protein CHLRE_11g467736v5 [Chlamydomonas reinhardtii]
MSSSSDKGWSVGDLEVIGAGWARTGTTSLWVALNKLGYKTHHMREVFQHQKTQPAAWEQAAADKAAGRPINWAAVLGGYTACVDWPSAIVYKELLAANPKAKVILSVRDSFDAWYSSCLDTIYPVVELGLSIRPPAMLKPMFRGLCKFFTMQLDLVYDPIFGGYERFKDKEHVRKIYEAHLAEVKRVVPPGQLLIFNPKDGWGPLCAFLGKEPPADGAPYPYVNETPEFKERMKGLEKLAGAMEKATWVQWGLVAAAGVAVAVVMRARAGAGAK